MSIKVTTYVWEHSKQKGAALLMLLAIADQANDDGEAWPSVKTLARKARVSKRSVQRTIDRLEAARELVVGERPTDTSRSMTNLYTVITSWNVKNVTQEDDTGVTQRMTRVSPREDDTGVTRIINKEPSIEPSIKTKDAGASSSEFTAMKDAIAEAFGWPSPTQQEWGVIQKAAKSLLEANCIPSDAASLYAECQRRGWTNFSPVALTKVVSDWRRSQKATHASRSADTYDHGFAELELDDEEDE